MSATEREQLQALPESPEEFVHYCPFGAAGLPLICQDRGAASRPGFAVQLCYLRFPGVVPGIAQLPA